MSESQTNTPQAATKSKKRELTSPEFFVDTKKNKVSLCSESEESGAMETPTAHGSLTLGEGELQKLGSFLQDHFKLQLQDIVSSIVDGVLTGLNNKIVQLETENADLKARVKSLEQSADTAEQYSRRNCVRISGVPEVAVDGTEGGQVFEDTDAYVMQMAKDLKVDLALSEIDRSHRVGKKLPTKPREIIVKFATYRARQKLYKARTRAKESGYDGIFVNEDLTRKRSHLLFLARKLVKDKCIAGAWSSDGTILIKDKLEKLHAITSDDDLAKYRT